MSIHETAGGSMQTGFEYSQVSAELAEQFGKSVQVALDRATPAYRGGNTGVINRPGLLTHLRYDPTTRRQIGFTLTGKGFEWSDGTDWTTDPQLAGGVEKRLDELRAGGAPGTMTAEYAVDNPVPRGDGLTDKLTIGVSHHTDKEDGRTVTTVKARAEYEFVGATFQATSNDGPHFSHHFEERVPHTPEELLGHLPQPSQ